MESPSSPQDAIRVTARVRVPRSELEWRASRAGGPGGQHVNTSSTRIELRWNVRTSAALTGDERARVEAALASRLDSDGTLRIVSSEHRSQLRNREAAEARFVQTLRGALAVPKRRRTTKRPRGAEEARLQAKRERADRKQKRRWRLDD